MKKLIIILLLIPFVNQYSQGYALTLKASSSGANLEFSNSLSEHFNMKAGLSYFSYDLNGGGGKEDFYYKGNLKLFSLAALFDYFPFHSIIRITSGLIVNLNQGTMQLHPVKTYNIGNDVYTPDIIGYLDANVTVNRIVPYLGIGIGNPHLYSGLSFNFDIGTYYQGQPDVKLKAYGLLQPSESQESVIEENLNWFVFYPVISFGISYNFSGI